jgi:hypothetical protein
MPGWSCSPVGVILQPNGTNTRPMRSNNIETLQKAGYCAIVGCFELICKVFSLNGPSAKLINGLLQSGTGPTSGISNTPESE